jgi:hypothetical protein
VAALAAACDANVVIGARLSLTEGGSAGQVSSAGTESGGGFGGAGNAGGAPSQEQWCATSPWDGTSAKFDGDSGSVIPAGTYVIAYLSGAQVHDPDIGYEVTRHYYGSNGLPAGHHVFSGENPETGATSLWLDELGIVGAGGTIDQVEAANRGHTWPLRHAGGELRVVLYDDDYHDNQGPGTRLCIAAFAP